MTYSVDSSLVGYRAIRSGWRDALTAHGAANVDGILGSYDGWCRRYHLDPNLLLAQACQEAAWFTSARWVNEHSPAGLGVTSDNTPPHPYASEDAGIEAHCAHVCAYAYTLAECPVDHRATQDFRHVFHDGVSTLGSFERPGVRQWAYPGTGYIAAIARIANSIPDNGGPPMADFPTAADLGFAVRLEPTDFVGADRPLGDIDWNVIHDTEGHFEGDIAVLTHGSRNGSVHAIIGREPGQFVASVPIRTTAWTAGNDTLGARAIQVELSKATDEHGYTDWQYTAAAAFFRWCEGQGVTVPRVYLGLHPKDDDNGPLPDERGYIGHAGVPDGSGGWGGFAHHQDPGPEFQWDRFIALLGDTPPPPPSDVLRINGFVIGGGFKRLYTSTPAALEAFGNPLSDETQATVTDADKTARKRTVQLFERAVFIFQPENAPPWDVVCALRTQKIKPLS